MTVAALERIQRETRAVWSAYLRRGDAVALVDFPAYPNAGDTLIYLGERQYLDALGVRVRYLADSLRYDAALLRRHHPEGPILIRGGGNLGDRWTHLQDFREQVIRDFPDRLIIQLPQSVDFRDPERTRQAQAVFGAHKNLVVMIRESPSMETARRLFPDTAVVFCPDAAFGIGSQERLAGRASTEVVKVLRRDSEKNDIGLSRLDGPETDWGFTGAAAVAWNAVRVPQFVARRVPRLAPALYPAVVGGFAAQAALNRWQATRAVSRGRVLVTDRLHAAVLGALTGMPVLAGDNSYGKVSAIYADYLHGFENVAMVSSLEEARERLGVLLG